MKTTLATILISGGVLLFTYYVSKFATEFLIVYFATRPKRKDDDNEK